MGADELLLRPLESEPLAEERGEADILRRAKAGEAGAFEALVIRHERIVFRTALRLLGEREAARDAAQEVFLRLHKYLRGFDPERELRPWLYRMTVNASRDEARRRQGRQVSLEELSDGPELPELTRPADADAQVELAERRQIVGQALKILPEKERAALVLRDIEGLPTAEVAQILGSSEATVRSQICTGRVKIKRYVERYLTRRV